MKRQGAIIYVYRILFLVFASYGIFYFSYKYYIPWPNQNDYAQYYPMYLAPLDFSQAQAPFIYRQVSAVITNAIYQAGIFYPNEIQFTTVRAEQQLFFSALFSNYVALLLTAAVVGMMVAFITKSASFLPGLLAGLLCFTAFFTQKGVITEMTEGWSWLLMAIGFFAYLRHNHWLVIVVMLLAIFQRETIPLVLGTIAAIDLVLARQEVAAKAFRFRVIMGAILASGGYLLIRTVLLPVPEYEGGAQLQWTQITANLTTIVADLLAMKLSQELLFQGVVTQNTYLIFLCTVSIAAIKMRHKVLEILLHRSYLLQISGAMLLLYTVGIATGLGNNVGRVAALLTPITVVYIVVLIVQIDQYITNGAASCA